MSDNQKPSNMTASIKNLTAYEAFTCMSLRAQRNQFEDFLAVIYYAQPKYVLLVNGGECSVRKNIDGRFYIEHKILGQEIHLSDIDEFISPNAFMSDGYGFECQLMKRVLPRA